MSFSTLETVKIQDCKCFYEFILFLYNTAENSGILIKSTDNKTIAWLNRALTSKNRLKLKHL